MRLFRFHEKNITNSPGFFRLASIPYSKIKKIENPLCAFRYNLTWVFVFSSSCLPPAGALPICNEMSLENTAIRFNRPPGPLLLG